MMTETSAPPSVGDAWRQAFARPRFLFEGCLSLLLLAVATYVCMAVIHYAHVRPGAVLQDPILTALGPVSLRWPMFLVLWSSLFAGVCSLVRSPSRLLMWLQASAVLLSLRAFALYLTPLEPLPSIIPLADPVATLRTETGALIVNDLFFSGHTATLFLLFLAVSSRRMKGVLLAAVLFTGFGVMLHHAHYSVDVFAAPFFALGSWRIVVFVHERFEQPSENASSPRD